MTFIDFIPLRPWSVSKSERVMETVFDKHDMYGRR